MQLSLYTDYALRVLLFLGANQERRVSMQEISDCYGISREHLRKVVHMLAQHEIIETYRGKNGGFVLRKTPAEINIGNLVEITEKRKRENEQIAAQRKLKTRRRRRPTPKAFDSKQL